VTPNFTFNINEAYVLLCDDLGIINNSTSNFIEKFIGNNFFSFEDARIFIHDVIPDLLIYSETELSEGILVKMLS
jgi:hypothetical protein